MAHQALVLDASIGVKWFSSKGEAFLENALAIREAHIADKVMIIVPDLFYYEVANAIVQKKSIPVEVTQFAAAAMFALNFRTVHMESDLLKIALKISRQFDITVYDSCYIAAAQSFNCPLVTANPRHQRTDMGCRVIPIEQWGREES